MPRSRYEEEIEQILDKDERRARRVQRVQTVKRQVARRKSRFTSNPGNLMWAGGILVLAGLGFRRLFVPLAGIGLLLFLIGYVTYFARSRRPRHERGWRGQVVDYPDSWSNRFRRFFSRRR